MMIIWGPSCFVWVILYVKQYLFFCGLEGAGGSEAQPELALVVVISLSKLVGAELQEIKSA